MILYVSLKFVFYISVPRTLTVGKWFLLHKFIVAVVLFKAVFEEAKFQAIFYDFFFLRSVHCITTLWVNRICVLTGITEFSYLCRDSSKPCLVFVFGSVVMERSTKYHFQWTTWIFALHLSKMVTWVGCSARVLHSLQ